MTDIYGVFHEIFGLAFYEPLFFEPHFGSQNETDRVSTSSAGDDRLGPVPIDMEKS